MKRYLLVFCLVGSMQALGATPHVPTSMWVADIKLHITKDAKKRIQEKADRLTRNERYCQTLLQRANLFLPIIERVLKEENIPLDFRYLVIQESALIADAVSSANAVGFWQFLASTALESGLKINSAIDERMHITAATRGATSYLKRHNQHLDNWLYTLLAYNTGRGYVEKRGYKKYCGAKQIRIDSQTHWYIIHFLAHKLVFENKVGKERHPTLCLYEYQAAPGKTLSEIAKEFGVDKKQLQAYNKWLKCAQVPYDTTCTVIIPMTHQQYAQNSAAKAKHSQTRHKLDYAQYWKQAAAFPAITTQKYKKSSTVVTKINGIVGTQAQPGDSLTSLAQAGKISLEQFLTLNDIDKKHLVIPGQVYYYQPKHSKAGTHFHITRPGETWWSVAQKYGIKKKKLLLKNRLRQEVALKPGRVLWLRFIRPARIPIAYEQQGPS